MNIGNIYNCSRSQYIIISIWLDYFHGSKHGDMRTSVTPLALESSSIIVSMHPGQPPVSLLVSMDSPPVHIRHGRTVNVHVIVADHHLDGLAAEEAKLTMASCELGVLVGGDTFFHILCSFPPW